MICSMSRVVEILQCFAKPAVLLDSIGALTYTLLVVERVGKYWLE
jgi:hypothetical protein